MRCKLKTAWLKDLKHLAKLEFFYSMKTYRLKTDDNRKTKNRFTRLGNNQKGNIQNQDKWIYL